MGEMMAEIFPASQFEIVRRLQRQAIQQRRMILNMVYHAQAGHTGGSLSCVDILTVLYQHVMDIRPENFARQERDHYIHSKGHAVEALYAALATRGFFPPQALENIERCGSDWIGHPTRKVPGIEHNTGALGHGLAFAVGLALAGQQNGGAGRVFTLMGDGELAEGSIWEALASAAHYRLERLTAIVDRNGLQISGRTEDVMALEPLAQKFSAFGWAVQEVDGHDVRALVDVFDRLPFEADKPSLILAHTVKGKGVSFMENQKQWHHRVPREAEYAAALEELAQAEKALEVFHEQD